jgi:hypothetical protein
MLHIQCPLYFIRLIFLCIPAADDDGDYDGSWLLQNKKNDHNHNHNLADSFTAAKRLQSQSLDSYSVICQLDSYKPRHSLDSNNVICHLDSYNPRRCLDSYSAISHLGNTLSRQFQAHSAALAMFQTWPPAVPPACTAHRTDWPCTVTRVRLWVLFM